MSEAPIEEIEPLTRACLMASFAGPVAPSWLLDELAAGLGAVALFASNVESDRQVGDLVATLRGAGPEVVIAIDEEGGDVTRLDVASGSLTPGNAALGVIDDVDATAAAYRVIGRRLAALGIDLDLAPCADINLAPANPVIGVRSFGSDATLVSRHVRAAIHGLQSVGVAACAKHFPGHGAAGEDSHVALPLITAETEELRSRELVPFAAAVEAGTAAIMTAHIVVGSVDAAPATRSHRVLGLLREELHFGGVVVSDALDMAGVHGAEMSPRDVTPEMIGIAAVAALDAGCDLLCLGAGQDRDVPTAVVAKVVDAVRRGELAFGRLAAAARRCTALSHRWTTTRDRRDAVDADADADAALTASLAQRVVAGKHSPPVRGAVVVDCRPQLSAANSDVPWGLGVDIAAVDPSTITVDASEITEASDILHLARGRPLVVAIRSAAAHPWQRRLVESLSSERRDLVVVELGWPDAKLPVALTTWGASRGSTRAAAEVLTGQLVER